MRGRIAQDYRRTDNDVSDAEGCGDRREATDGKKHPENLNRQKVAHRSPPQDFTRYMHLPAAA